MGLFRAVGSKRVGSLGVMQERLHWRMLTLTASWGGVWRGPGDSGENCEGTLCG